jgi:hypothetical protein
MVRSSIGRTSGSQPERRGSTPRRTTRGAAPTPPGTGDVAQLEEAAVSDAARCGFDSHRHHWLELAGYANGHSGQVESLMFVGSTPTLVTAEWTGVGFQRGLISRPTPVRIRPPQLDSPVVEREDAPLIWGRSVVRSHPGLLSGTHVPRAASLSCKQTGVGSIPTVSTDGR